LAKSLLPRLLQLLQMHAIAAVAHGSRPPSASTKENIAQPHLAQPYLPVRADSATSTRDDPEGCAAVAGADAGAPCSGDPACSDSCSESEGGVGSAGTEAKRAEQCDLLVKLVRLVAHLAISRSVGEVIARAPELVSLLGLLETFGSEMSQEELLLNVVSAITNVTFYIDCLGDGAVDGHMGGHVLLEQHERLCGLLAVVLTHSNEEAVIEASRALGNLSRQATVRRAICASRAHEALLLLLYHQSVPIVEAATGALVNLAADGEQSAILLQADGATRIADMLLHLLSTPPADPAAVSGVILGAKTLCNLCCASIESPLAAEQCALLSGILEHATPPAWVRQPPLAAAFSSRL
jgi:hypothetical protein